jgi:hypothetical protein
MGFEDAAVAAAAAAAAASSSAANAAAKAASFEVSGISVVVFAMISGSEINGVFSDVVAVVMGSMIATVGDETSCGTDGDDGSMLWNYLHGTLDKQNFTLKRFRNRPQQTAAK